MKRLTNRTEPYYCSPETPHGDCPGIPLGHGNNHGVASDEWYFTVLHGVQATTLMVFGTDLHEGMPANHSVREYWASRGVKGGTVSVCMESGGTGKGKEFCLYLEKPCRPGGISYNLGDALWFNAGIPFARLDQADSFWEALELVARSWCEGSCCAALTDAEEAKLKPLLVRPATPWKSS